MVGTGARVVLVAAAACVVVTLAAGLSFGCGGPGGPIADCFPQPTPVCGTPCTNPCGGGCAPCTSPPDVKWCSEGTVLHCPNTTCAEVVEVCSEADACIVSTCAKSVSDCGAVRDAYEAQVSASTAAVVREGSGGLSPGEYGQSCPSDCAVAAGDCDIGLETCWLIGGRTQEVNRLAALYERLGCSGSVVCGCAPLEVQVSCRGISSPDGTFLHNACVAQ